MRASQVRFCREVARLEYERRNEIDYMDRSAFCEYVSTLTEDKLGVHRYTKLSFVSIYREIKREWGKVGSHRFYPGIYPCFKQKNNI